MRIHVTIDAERNEQDVPVTLTPEDGRITFGVPNAGRASACTFSVDAGQLQEALRHLGSLDRHRQIDPEAQYDAAIDELKAEARQRVDQET